MDSVLSSYSLSSSFMIIILCIFVARTFSAISVKSSRSYSLVLIGGTALYVLVDFAFISCHLSKGVSVRYWEIIAFVFYLVYTGLPFAWHIFVRNFVGSTFSKTLRMVELIPIVILLGMVLITPFTGSLYYFDADGMYARGPLYNIYSFLNYFYYAESILDLTIVYIRRRKMDERYAFRTMLISLVMLIGAFLNSTVIPAGTIFPFMPFCSVVVTVLAFYFIASKDSEMLKMRLKRHRRPARLRPPSSPA